MHLSHVGIYSATFPSLTDASLPVGVVRNMPDPLSPPEHPLWWASWAPRAEGPSQGCSGMRPCLVSTWLVWLPPTKALLPAWANLSQGGSNQIFLSSPSSLPHEDTSQGAAARKVCPAFPWEGSPSPSQEEGGWAWGKHHTACAIPSPAVLGPDHSVPKCGHGGKLERGREFGEMAPEGHYPGAAPHGAQLLLQAPLEWHDQAAERVSVVWVIPLWRV